MLVARCESSTTVDDVSQKSAFLPCAPNLKLQSRLLVEPETATRTLTLPPEGNPCYLWNVFSTIHFVVLATRVAGVSGGCLGLRNWLR
jgi:hypothetical protein